MEDFKGREIDGYYVRPMMQRIWAAQMDVLKEVDKICNRHSIKWFASFGTLLGAVRHKGFIPWDDDIDIGMRRLDFERFKRYVAKELPDGYTFNLDRGSDIKDLVFNIKNGNKVNTDEDYLEKHHGCPYPVGIDIFIYDNVPADEKERQDYMALFSYTMCGAQEIEPWMTYNDCSDEAKEIIDTSEKLTGIHYDKSKPLKTPLLILSDQIAAMYYDIDTDYIAIAGYLTWGEKYLLRREWFDSIINLPFEDMQMKCPAGYSEILKRDFGDDYMIPKIYQEHEHSFVKQEQELHRWYREHDMEIPKLFLD